MKNLFTSLFFIIISISLISCNSGKLEWWESIKTPKQRTEHASGRNDDSNFEKIMFNQMENLEIWASLHKIKSFDTHNPTFDNMTSKEFNEYLNKNTISMKDVMPIHPIMFVIKILSVFLILFMLFTGRILRSMDIGHDWFAVFTAILCAYNVIYSIIVFLLTDTISTPTSKDIGNTVVIIGLIFTIPNLMSYDILGTNYKAPQFLLNRAYGLILPIALVGGACKRTITTYSSYIFLLMMGIYIIAVLITSIKTKQRFWKILISILYKIMITIGTVIILYIAMPSMVHILNGVIIILIAFSLLRPSSNTDGPLTKQERDHAEWEEKRRISDEIDDYVTGWRNNNNIDNINYKGKKYRRENGEWTEI